jgi:hypothetical protein
LTFVAPDWPSRYTNQYVYTWDKSIHNITNETVPEWIRFRQNNYSNHCRKNDHYALHRDPHGHNTQELHLEYTRWLVLELNYSILFDICASSLVSLSRLLAIDGPFYLVLMIVTITPTANTVMVMVELSDGEAKEGMARIICMQYTVAPVLLSISVMCIVQVATLW